MRLSTIAKRARELKHQIQLLSLSTMNALEARDDEATGDAGDASRELRRLRDSIANVFDNPGWGVVGTKALDRRDAAISSVRICLDQDGWDAYTDGAVEQAITSLGAALAKHQTENAERLRKEEAD